MKRFISIMALIISVMLVCCACSKSVTISVIDAGQTQEIQTKTGTTVEKALEDAGVSVATDDEVSPSLDTEITEDTTEITIKRYAKVTVKKGLDSKEIALVGGTVQDAVDKAGFEIKEDEELDHDAKEHLTDGMIIKIQREVTVTLKADGESKDIKTKAATVKEFLDEQGVTLGEDDEVSEKSDALLENDMKITVKRVEYKEETRTESIDYETVEKSDDSMYKGESKTVQEGAKGEKEVTYKVKYVDGEKDSEEKTSEKVTKEPTDKIVSYGTKAKKLTEAEAEAIVRSFWGSAASSESTNIVESDGLKVSGGTEYYAFRLRWRVDDGGGKFHYSTIDFQKVNAYTGEVVSGG